MEFKMTNKSVYEYPVVLGKVDLDDLINGVNPEIDQVNSKNPYWDMIKIKKIGDRVGILQESRYGVYQHLVAEIQKQKDGNYSLRRKFNCSEPSHNERQLSEALKIIIESAKNYSIQPNAE